jgi:Dolichyl-phosphate-mannose-protein mannosyltransferase
MAGEMALARPVPPEEESAPVPQLAPVDRRIFALAAAVFTVLMAFSARYGFHRDELYFLDCARHLSWSYVDQPVLVPLLARISLDLFGVSAVGLRLWPALAAAATVVTCGMLAREFGGRKTAQLTCAVGVATAPALIGAGHILDTTSIDMLAWSGLALIAVRMGRTGDMRLWMPAGAVTGIGLANKHLMGFFALAFVIGTLLSGGRRLLANRFFAIGALIAFAFTIPDLWWQAHHQWATIAMTRSLAAEHGGLHNAILFIFLQLFILAPVFVGLCLAGLRSLWRSGRPLWRALAWSYGILVVLFCVTSGGQDYYAAPMYFFLLAAGAVVYERRWAVAPGHARVLLGVALPLYTLLTLAISLPVLPARLDNWTRYATTVQVDTTGWPELDATVAQVWDQLPASERGQAVIVTGNYGEAGAINELGSRYHLPQAVSGQNNEWWWGPGNPRARTVVAVVPAVGPGSAQLVTALRHDFAHIRVAATITNPAHLINAETGGRIYICTGPARSWASQWPSLRYTG